MAESDKITKKDEGWATAVAFLTEKHYNGDVEKAGRVLIYAGMALLASGTIVND